MNAQLQQEIPHSTIEEKLFTVKYKPGPTSHLIPDQNDCQRCESKACNYFCPANVYHWDSQQSRNLVAFENCFECGACRLGCVYQSIEWVYPKDGCGVTFRHG
jgi:ferredoxin like protein